MTNPEGEAGEYLYTKLGDAKTPPGSPIHQTSGGVCSNYSTRRNSDTKRANLFPSIVPFSLCECRSQLEDEAVKNIAEFSFAVKTMCLSEMLPRTAELLFINLTTLEGATYCVELTGKGWRICSYRQDCMNGDFRQLAIHTRYFESLYQLLDTISPLYREQFGTKLLLKLQELKQSAEGVN